jgi:hypothetical protein
MKAHPIFMLLIGWIVGSFFGLGAVMGLVKGVGAKPAQAAA